MKNMDKGFTVPKWVMIVRPKIPQMPLILSAQTQKFRILMKKQLHWWSVVRDCSQKTDVKVEFFISSKVSIF